MNLHRHVNPPVSIFLLEGRVGWESSRILDEKVRESLLEGCRHLVFQIDSDRLSSGAIGVFVAYLRRLSKVNGSIHFVIRTDYVRDLFEMIGFTGIFRGRIMDSLEAVRTSLAEGWGVEMAVPASDDYISSDSCVDVEDKDMMGDDDD